MVVSQADSSRMVQQRHAVAPALLAGGIGHGLPPGLFAQGALSAQFEHAARRLQRLHARSTQPVAFSTSQSMRSLAGIPTCQV